MSKTPPPPHHGKVVEGWGGLGLLQGLAGSGSVRPMRLFSMILLALICGCATTGKPAFQTQMIREGMKLKADQLSAVGETWPESKLRQQAHRQLYYDRKFYLETVRRVYATEGKQLSNRQLKEYGELFDRATDSPYMP